MNLSEFNARRAAQPTPKYRETCAQCRKALPTCYCHKLRPFLAPVPFVILQHPDEARNAIATARMAHLSMTNSRLIVGREFKNDKAVNELIADTSQRHLVLYPSRDAVPIEQVFDEHAAPKSRPPVFWVLDAKWSQVPKMLRLSPNIQALPRVRFEPDRASFFQIRKQPHPACLSTIESIFLVIERLMRRRQTQTAEHHALIDIFQHLVHQQLGFVNVEADTRHRAAKLMRASRREKRLLER